MGTRSTTHIYNGKINKKNHLVSIYRQFDGYLSGYGIDLINYLSSMTVVNGYNSSQENGQYANGMGCLSAQLIKHFKEGIGGCCITNSDDSQEYDYHVYTHNDKIHIKIVENDKLLFNGSLFEFDKFYKKYLLSEE